MNTFVGQPAAVRAWVFSGRVQDGPQSYGSVFAQRLPRHLRAHLELAGIRALHLPLVGLVARYFGTSGRTRCQAKHYELWICQNACEGAS